MIRSVAILAGLAAVASACGSETTTPPPSSPETPAVTVTLPPGDAMAGRQAFQDLRCTACHAVPSDAEMPAPISANPGPPIDARVAGQDVSYLLASIMTPSHEISPNISDEVRKQLEGVLSPMGDFSRVMTVRQLIDLHAYVRSIR
jgi:hypothetical protein